jgi:polar amino acid transport system ATP-binding protein
MRQAAVALKKISKTYGNQTVLHEVDMEVPPGQAIAIIGPSGSGKSSLLRLVMGLERPDAGEVFIEGESLWGVGKRQQRRLLTRVGMVFQQFNLFPHMSVLHNITEAPVHVLKLTRAEAETRARALLEQVELGDRAGAWPSQLSGGQKQRVAIARALAMQPAIMLFDEVTSALDPELVGGVLNLIQKLAAQRSMTLLIVTHHLAFARRCADRIVFLDGGSIVDDVATADFFSLPRPPRVRQFLEALIE